MRFVATGRSSDMTIVRPAFAVLLLLFIAARSFVFADEPAPSGKAEFQSTVGLLTAAGRVVLPDGSPAVGATVRSMPDDGERPISVRTNAAGEFRLHDLFGNGCRLHAATADGKQQTTLRIAAGTARKVLA